MFGRRTTLVTAATASSLACAAFVVVAQHDEGQTIRVSREHSAAYGAQPFDISVDGSAPRGLYPGVTKGMKLKLRNPYEFPLLVSSLRGEVAASSRSGCKPVATNLVPGAYEGRLPLLVPAEGEAAAGVIPLRMPLTADEACQGAKFTIRLYGKSTKAGR